MQTSNTESHLVHPSSRCIPPLKTRQDQSYVVFDCSAEYRNYCLNKELLQGQDLTNQLIGVLLRFRENPIAVMADIESMFYQVHVPEKYHHYLRFYGGQMVSYQKNRLTIR